MSALSAEALSFAYPDGPPALEGVDLAIESGELVFVIGPNGSGKSTLLKLFGGLLRPDTGSARLDGRALAALRARARARSIAFVPQGLAALPTVEVETFVLGGRYARFGLFGRTEPRDWEAVRRAIDEADVGAFKGRFLNELSGGQCQRVLVARALAQEASVLLFDEPTAALDPEHQIRIYDLIEGAARDGKAVLVATHELWLAGRYATRIVLLERGRVVADGPPQAVLTRAVLEPVYGPCLAYREAPGGGAGPLVVPWPAAEARARPLENDPPAGSSARRPGV